MITPSHIIYSWAAAKYSEGSPNKLRVVAIITGGFLPDVPTYLFFIVHTFILGTTQSTMWDTLYFDSAWTPFITLSHSLILWPLLLLFAKMFKQRVLFWVSASSLVHSALDFLVHHDDAYRHFWPLSDWKFLSPVSYYDPNYFGTLFGLVDFVVVILLLTYLHSLYKHNLWIEWTIRLLMLLYVLITFVPLVFFTFN